MASEANFKSPATYLAEVRGAEASARRQLIWQTRSLLTRFYGSSTIDSQPAAASLARLAPQPTIGPPGAPECPDVRPAQQAGASHNDPVEVEVFFLKASGMMRIRDDSDAASLILTSLDPRAP
eukprot:scaffold1108_cov260-Pinguiococcus_pyrenoidosus.AAC.15